MGGGAERGVGFGQEKVDHVTTFLACSSPLLLLFSAANFDLESLARSVDRIE